MTYKVWYAKEAAIKLISATGASITSAAAIDTFFTSGTAIEGTMKDITFTEPIGDVDILQFHGVTARDDGVSFQNAEAEEKPAGMGEVSGTAILPGDEAMEAIIYGTGVAVGGTHTRYAPGNQSKTKVAVLLNLTDGTDEVSYAVDNAWLTAREVKSTGADGHMEVSVSFKCLPRDWYGPEFKN